MEAPAQSSERRVGELPDAGAAPSPPPSAPGGESHLRLLHAALSVADSARREAERDNTRLREELAALQEQLALVLARLAATRTEAVDADENCGVISPPADADSHPTPPVCSDVAPAAGVSVAGAPDAARSLALAPRQAEMLSIPDADDASAARGELRRRAAALGLAGSALFPKAMHRV